MGNKFDFEHFYVVEKPMYKRAASYDTHYHFKVKQRNGNDIVFSNSDRKDICEYPAKVLTIRAMRFALLRSMAHNADLKQEMVLVKAVIYRKLLSTR